MTRRSTDVLNRTWTIIDDNDVIDEETSEQGGVDDDINNNTKCIVNIETNLSTTINKRKSTYLNVPSIDSFKRFDLSDSQEFDSKSLFLVKLYNIDQHSEAFFLKDIETFLKRAISCYDPIQNEIFHDYICDDDKIFDENTNILIRLSVDTSFSNNIPNSFDVFINDLNNKNRVSSEKDDDYIIKNETFDAKRSISELDLKNPSIEKLLEVNTSSPLKKMRYFSSNDQDLQVVNTEEDIDLEIETDTDESDDDRELPVFNLTYTSLNTNEEQIEEDIKKQHSSSQKFGLKKESNENLNRTFSKDDQMYFNTNDNEIKILDAQLPIIQSSKNDQTILIEDPAKYHNLQSTKPQLTSVPALNQTVIIHESQNDNQNLQTKQITPTSNTKIPKFGIPRVSRIPSSQINLPSFQTSSSSASVTSNSTSSSSSLTSSTTALPQLAEVKNQMTIKTIPPNVSKKSPVKTVYQQLPQVASNKNILNSKENQIDNEKLKRPSNISASQSAANEVRTSINTQRLTTYSTKPPINSELRKNTKSSSMIPSLKSALPVPKTSTIPVYKK